MKNSNSLLVLVLFVVGIMASSCSTQRGCRGGGWYGDRNLTSVEMEQPSSEVNVIEITATEHCTD